MGWSTVPLGQLHGANGARALAASGVEVRLGAPVTGLGAGPRGPMAGRRPVTGTSRPTTSSWPPRRRSAAGLVPAGALAPVEELGTSPIVNVHLVFDRRVTDLVVLCAACDSPVQFVFDRTGSSGPTEGQYLAVSLSAADADIGRRPEELVADLPPGPGSDLPGRPDGPPGRRGGQP